MLHEIFCTVLKMNFAATVAAAVILPLKALLHKLGFPRRTLFFLWAVVAFRLICPFSAGTDFSLYNLPRHFVRQTAPAESGAVAESYLMSGTAFELPKKNAENTGETNKPGTAAKQGKTEGVPDKFLLAAYIWASGMAVLLASGAVSAIRLKYRLRFAVRYCGNVFAAENIPESFVFGLQKPKIYIPPRILKNNPENIIAHEKMHIKRCDHAAKLLAYALLAVHWFNPLCWVLAKLFSDDMELCCDEAVIESGGCRIDYAKTLLENAAKPSERIAYLCTVGFSGNITKRRIKNAVQYKKSGILKRIGAVSVCVFAAAVLCTNAAPQNPLSAATSAPADTAVEPTSAAPAPEPTERENAEKIADKREEKPPLSEDKGKTAEEKTQQTVRESQAAAAEKPEPERKTESRVYKYDSANVNKGVHCDSDGNISVSFSLSTESLVEIAFYDSETGKTLESGTVAAGTAGAAHVFSGFDTEKTYDVVITGRTGNDWLIEGTYKIN